MPCVLPTGWWKETPKNITLKEVLAFWLTGFSSHVEELVTRPTHVLELVKKLQSNSHPANRFYQTSVCNLVSTVVGEHRANRVRKQWNIQHLVRTCTSALSHSNAWPQPVPRCVAFIESTPSKTQLSDNYICSNPTRDISLCAKLAPDSSPRGPGGRFQMVCLAPQSVNCSYFIVFILWRLGTLGEPRVVWGEMCLG